jgi:hypothetical protein
VRRIVKNKPGLRELKGAKEEAAGSGGCHQWGSAKIGGSRSFASFPQLLVRDFSMQPHLFKRGRQATMSICLAAGALEANFYRGYG